MLTPGVAARSTLSASAVTSGPMPSPPTTASLMVRELMPEPYWRVRLVVGGGGGVRGRSPPLSRRSRAVWTAWAGEVSREVAWRPWVAGPAGPEGLGRVVPLAVRVPGIHVVHGTLLIEIRIGLTASSKPPQRVAGLLRSGSAAAGDEYEVPHSALPLPQRGTGRTPLKTSVSISETLFLVPSFIRCAKAREAGAGNGTAREAGPLCRHVEQRRGAAPRRLCVPAAVRIEPRSAHPHRGSHCPVPQAPGHHRDVALPWL